VRAEQGKAFHLRAGRRVLLGNPLLTSPSADSRNREGVETRLGRVRLAA